MTDALLSDDDVGLGGASQSQQAPQALLSDEDVGIAKPAPVGSSGKQFTPNPNPVLRAMENFAGVPEHLPGAAAPDESGPLAAITDIPSEIGSAASGAWNTIKSNLNPFSAERRAATEAQAKEPFLSGFGPQIEQTLGVGSGLASIPALAASPLTGTARSVVGHTLAQTVPGESYEQGKADADLLVSAMGAKGATAPAVVPPNPVGPFGVVKSAGQLSGDVGQLQNEYAAASGNLGPRAQKVAQAFQEQQKAQLADAQSQVASSLSPTGATLAESPQEAGNIVSQGVQSAAANAKADVKAKYEAAKSLPGEIDAGVFYGDLPPPGQSLAIPGQTAAPPPRGPTIGTNIKSALSAGADPIIVDDKLTPFASAAIQDLDNNVSKLRIPNRADPNAPPSPDQITDVSLAGIDQWRKRLSSFRNQAYQSGNMADGRAASAVLNAFDDQIDAAVNNGRFSGDPMAVQAWNDARAANADYRSTFTASGRNDPVGRVVQKIVGDRQNDPAIGNDVADFIYGGTGTNPNSLNFGVANRVKSIFGEQSPEWAAVKQGLFNRLTKPTPGTTDWGSQRIATNVSKFLNGDGQEMANAVFSPAERQMIQSYGDLHQSLIPPPGTRNPSGTSPFVVKAMNAISGHVGEFAGAALGHMLLPGVPEVVSAPVGAGAVKGASALSNMMQARKIAQAMPTVAGALKSWSIAAAKAQGNYAPQTARSLAYMSARLQNSLRPFGISLNQVLAGTAQAQQSKPGPNAQQNNNGQTGNQQGFAHGGAVNPSPTDAQKEAGNYKKRHIRLYGLEISIENEKGSYRYGTGNDGKSWSVKMPSAYGYIRKTIGGDGDHVDCYIGPHEESQKVFIVDQMDLRTKRFDEHKAILNCRTQDEAARIYRAGFSDGKGGARMMKITPMSIDQFREWLKYGDTTSPIKKVA